MKTGTLEELNVQPGDTVMRECALQHANMGPWVIKSASDGIFLAVKSNWAPTHIGVPLGAHKDWRVISRATDCKIKTWGELTDAEQNALLKAKCLGEEIEFWSQRLECWRRVSPIPEWLDDISYRVKPKPVVETVTIKGSEYASSGWVFDECARVRYAITFNTIDGKPDCSSVKMERVND